MGECLTSGDEGRFVAVSVCWEISAAASGARLVSGEKGRSCILIKSLGAAGLDCPLN